MKKINLVNVTKNTDGYTLMELLVVLLILGLIAGIAAPQVMSYLGRAKGSTAQLQLEALDSALDFYRIDMGEYPKQEQGLAALIEKPNDANNWFGPYIPKRSNMIDPWGEEFIYRIPGENGEYDLYSLGADKQQGGEGEDRDIRNWEELE